MTLDYSNSTTLNLGNLDAEHELTVISNLGCPHCKKWYSDNRAAIETGLSSGQLKVHFKYWNKDKASLKNGGFAQRYIDYQNVPAALKYINNVYQHQAELNATNYDDLDHYLETNFAVVSHLDIATIAQINQDVLQLGYLPLPTILLDNQMVGNTEYQLPLFKS